MKKILKSPKDKQPNQKEFPYRSGNEMFINKYLSARLENDETVIYVLGEKFQQCKFLQITIPIEDMTKVEDLTSIDEISDTLDHSLEPVPFSSDRRRENKLLDPEVEFWGHCSNLQVWYENDYNTNLLHSNLAFPLLKKLTDAGDPVARRVFSQEIAKRIDSGYLPVMFYLIMNRYILYLSPEDFESLEFFRKIEQYVDKDNYPEDYRGNPLFKGLKEYIEDISPKTAREWVMKANLNLLFNEPHKIIYDLEKGLQKFPESEILINNYVKELYKLNDLERAIPYYDKIIAKNPENPDVWNIYGSLHLYSTKVNESINLFKKAIELDPEFIIPRLNLVRAYHKLGFIKVGEDILKKILEMNLKDEKDLEMLAQVCHETEKLDLEIKALKQILFLNPENSMVWFVLSEIYRTLRKPLHCKRCLKKVVELNNDSLATSQALSALGVLAMEDDQDIDKSLEYLEKAVKINPENESAWLNLGPILIGKFQLERSEIVMKIVELMKQKRSMKANPQSPYYMELSQRITRLIHQYHNMEYKCPICKKTMKKKTNYCIHCGMKLGLTKEDMKKKIPEQALKEMRERHPFGRIPRFSRSRILEVLSYSKWKPFTKVCLDINATTKEEVQGLMEMIQVMVVEGDILQDINGGVIQLKKARQGFT